MGKGASGWRQYQLAAGAPGERAGTQGGRAGISVGSGPPAPLQVVLRLHLPLGSGAPTAGRWHGARGLPDQGQREARGRLCSLRYNIPSPILQGRWAWCLFTPNPFSLLAVTSRTSRPVLGISSPAGVAVLWSQSGLGGHRAGGGHWGPSWPALSFETWVLTPAHAPSFAHAPALQCGTGRPCGTTGSGGVLAGCTSAKPCPSPVWHSLWATTGHKACPKACG